MKEMSRLGMLTDDTMLAVMSEQKKPEKNEIVIPYQAIAKFFPKSYTPHQMERMIYMEVDFCCVADAMENLCARIEAHGYPMIEV